MGIDRATAEAAAERSVWAAPDVLRVLGPSHAVMPADVIEALIRRATAAVEALGAVDPLLLDKYVVDQWALGVEKVRRQVDAAGVAVADHVDTHNPFRKDGYFNAKSWLKHRLQLSGVEAYRRVQTAQMHRRLSQWANSEHAGAVGVAQTQLMAQIAANPRIESEVLRRDSWELLVDAMNLSFSEFELNVRRWESLADADGALAKAERLRGRRDATMRPTPDGGWHLVGSFDGVGGAEFNEIFAYFIEAEWRSDWAEARERLGEAVTTGDLCRTEPQRRADAMLAMARAAASAPPNRAAPLPTVNFLIDSATFEATLKGEPIEPRRYRDIVCRTQRGQQLHTADAVATALWAHVRRVVFDAASVVIDLGRRSRLFTGASREAVMLVALHCGWTGCDIPSEWCDADHSLGWRAHGATVPRNGGPFCHRHNVLKEQGFRVHRDELGRWHIFDPDGIEIV